MKSSLLLVPIIATVTVAITLVIGTVNRIALTQRLPEFGLLHASGHSKKWLTHRLTRETGVLAAAGWALGIGLSWLGLYVLKLAVFVPRGHDLNVTAWAPAVLALPVPLSVIGFARIGIGRVYSRLDPVVIFRTILVQVFSPKMGQWFSAIGGQSFSAKLGQGGGGEAPSQQAYLLFSRQRGQEAVCLERGRRPWISERC